MFILPSHGVAFFRPTPHKICMCATYKQWAIWTVNGIQHNNFGYFLWTVFIVVVARPLAEFVSGNCVNAEMGFLPCYFFKLTLLIFRYNLKCKFITFILWLMNVCIVWMPGMCWCAACSVHIIHYDRRSDDFVLHSAHNDYILNAKTTEKPPKKAFSSSSSSVPNEQYKFHLKICERIVMQREEMKRCRK